MISSRPEPSNGNQEVNRPGPEQSDAVDMAHLIGEIALHIETAGAPEEFYAAFLERVLAATGGQGAALWGADGQGGFQLLHQDHFSRSGLEPDTPAWGCHLLLLQDATLRTQAFWVPSQGASPASGARLEKGNFSALALLLAPVLVDRQVVGVLEVLQEPALDRQDKRARAHLATRLADFAAAYFQKSQRLNLIRQRHLWKDLEAFAQQIHRSLDPREVAYLVANDAKKLLPCDQVGVGLRYGGSCRVGAVSGALAVAPRSPLVKAMERLMGSIVTWGEPLHYDGTRAEHLPPRVALALDDYLGQSNSTRLLVVPLRPQGSGAREKPCGVLLAECFGPSGHFPQMRERLDLVAGHAAAALHNALTHDQLPLKWLSTPLARLREACQGRGLVKMAVLALIVLAVAGVLTLVQVPLRKEAAGQLVPNARRIVYAPLSGKILQVAAQHGDRVGKGQELLFVEDLETQLKVDQLSAKIGSTSQRLAFLEEQLRKVVEKKDQAELRADRIKIQYELRKAVVERDILLAEVRSPRKAAVLSPLAGQVLTFDTQEKLLGKEVKAGDPLLRVAAVDGGWEVEVFLPEREVCTIRRALSQSQAGELDVDLLLTSDPHRTYQGKLSRSGLGGETTIRNDKVVLPARLTLADAGLQTLLDGMPVGVEVHAKVHCGHAALGYVWSSELWDFVYERFLF